VDRHLVHEVQDTRDGATCNNVMVQVCILIVGQCDESSKRRGSILGDNLRYVTIDRLGPIIFNPLNI
jgi:hypothetical protein